MTRATHWAMLGLATALGVGCSTFRPEDSQALIDQGRYEQGLAGFEQALRERPADVERRIQYLRAREQVVNRLVGSAAAQLVAGRLDAAAAGFRQALAVDATHERAAAGLAAVDTGRRHQVLATDARARLAAGDAVSADLMVKAILAENASHPQARELDRELRDLERKKALTVPVLKSKLQSPVNLEFRDAPLKLLMEALAKSAGINFLLDRDIRADLKASIFVRNVRVEDALDLILQNNQLEKKVLTENTILIYPNTPQKLREHQELVMRTFRLSHADPKLTLNLLRTMLKSKDLYVDERSSSIIMRDTPDAIRAAEKLVAAQDIPDPEVVLELEILEVSRNKVRDLGITYPTELVGPAFGGGKLSQIGDFSRSTIDVDTGFKLKLLRTDGDTRTLANPRMRVRSRDKARVHVGDRIPVISSTIVGTTGGANGAPVTTEQIQYLDVGIKIEAEPTVHADDSVAIKINLDVSTLGEPTTTRAGTVAYPVGTRNATTVLRLRDGETQALMGLIRDDDSKSGGGLPFVGEVPGLDRIFGNQRTERRSRELVLLITPQLVRGFDRLDATAAEFWSGTEAVVRTGSPFVQPLAEPAGAAAARPALPPPGAGASAATPPGTPTTLTVVEPPAKPLVLSWQGPASVKAGEEFTVRLNARSAALVKGASVQLRYDPELLEVLSVDDGGYFAKVGGAAVFTPRVDPGLGTVFATMGATGMEATAGDGALLSLRLKARKAGAGISLKIGSMVGVDETNQRLAIEGSVPMELKTQP
ncbi:secretin and TonB N-terminal domain-containing protein [Ideonella sp. A 288]|uniref:secretin and TonB N-terminal domain-containing protein n=1 Tax=Ideonella sp. A 288 TaxID=1962181 RepID=UPI001F30AF9F|nr:secretin and TonB N-terminal domain-containing protein [Ideonella sp. A 288]